GGSITNSSGSGNGLMRVRPAKSACYASVSDASTLRVRSMSPEKATKTEVKTLASNRRAFHDYAVGERYEAGIALLGTEVKSLRSGKASLQDSFARVERGELFLFHCHIPPYTHRGYADHDPLRARKLLMHREEILKLAGRTRSGGATLVPLRLYLKK